MKIEELIKKIVEFIPAGAQAVPANRELELGLLKTMMMIAAVDGEITKKEISCFWQRAKQCEGLDAASLDAVWRSALTSAGYLAMQSLLLSREELVAEFLRVVDDDFVKRLVPAPHDVRKSAYKCLRAVAEADGDYSEVEKACIGALVRHVKDAWELKVSVQSVHL